MAMALRTELNLPTLRISLDLATSDAVFATVRGRERPVEAARCHLDDLRLPRSVYDAVDDDALTVPGAIVDRLTAVVDDLDASPVRPHNALWLEIPSPRGLLPVMPWERLLAPVGRPLYRLPFHPVRPHRPTDRLSVALLICAPDGDAADLALRITEQYRRHVPRVLVHVFSDTASGAAVTARLAGRSASRDVVVHEAGVADMTEHATASDLVTNPWLQRLLGALSGDRIDVVHLVAPGCLADGRGSLSLPDPTAGRGAEPVLVESAELVELLTRVGAVGLTLASPSGLRGSCGLRELADDVARLRPGLAAVHDLVADPDAEQLGVAIGTVLAPTDDAAVLPAMTAWLNPLFVDPAPAADQPEAGPEWTSRMRLLDDGASALLPAAARTAAVEQPEAWVASVARSIEQLQMAWLPAAADRPADPAAVEALNRVARLLDEHVPPAVTHGMAPPGGTP